MKYVATDFDVYKCRSIYIHLYTWMYTFAGLNDFFGKEMKWVLVLVTGAYGHLDLLTVSREA